MISNAEFLKRYDGEPKLEGLGTDSVLLPHEQRHVDEVIDKFKAWKQDIIAEKEAVSGGDDWHDGQFTATDNEAKILAGMYKAVTPFMNATVVDYPEPESPIASLGSRVTVSQNGFSYSMDIVGYRSGHPDDIIDEDGEPIEAVSVESPITKAVIGKELGGIAVAIIDTREVELAILGVDQTVVRTLFEE